MCLSAAGCCMSQVACCAASQTVSCCCKSVSCTKAIGAKVMYTVGFIATAVIAYILSVEGANIVRKIPNALTPICGDSCFQYFSVMKISLSMVLYHSLLFVVLLGASSYQDPRAVVQDGIWPIKFIVWLVSFVGCFFIPNESLGNYWIVCIVFSAFFILLQAIILVDFACSWAENWVRKYEETESNGWKNLLIGSVVVMISLIIVLSGLLYAYYSQNSGCGLNTFFVTFNLILVICICCASVSTAVQDKNPRSGLLQAAFIGMYNTYLVTSAVASDPSGQCQTGGKSGLEKDYTFSITMMYVGLAFTFISLGYAAFAAGTTEMVKRDEENVADDSDEPEYNYSFFHFSFVLASFYLASLLTNWNVSTLASNGVWVIQQASDGAMWVKIVTSWLVSILYLWTLVAPIVLKDRDFGY